MKKIIVITGTPGAGKTTVLEGAIHKYEKTGKEIKVLNYADVMLEVGQSLGLGKDHDAIRKISLKEQRDLQKKAAEKISAGAKGLTLVDTHCTVKTKRGYLPGLPEWVIKALNPHTIVLVEADPEEIVGRRKTDQTRKRDEEDIEQIGLQQEINRAAALTSASMCGATVKIIANHNNALDKAVDELVKVMEGTK